MPVKFGKHLGAVVMIKRKPWIPEDDAILKQLWEEQAPPAYIAKKLGRTEHSVLGRASVIHLPRRRTKYGERH